MHHFKRELTSLYEQINIENMGQMALGYGSEFHLLRWLGRHRNEFNKRVKDLLNIDNIIWLDFNFSKNEIPDKELVGIEFLKDELNYKKVVKLWEMEWPQSGKLMNWDLVGYTKENNKKCWILIEAKAHLGELEQNCNATSSNSIEKINSALLKTAENYGAKVSENKPWIKKYYQFANRLYVLDFFKRNEINAKLINIYFVGDMISKNRRSPQKKEEWSIKIKEMKEYLGFDTNEIDGIYELFIDIDE